MKQRTGRKLLSFLFTLAMVVGLLPGMSLTALAGNATNWDATTSLPTSAGNYKLVGDVTLSNTWTVPNGETTLDLNGQTINMTGNFSVITVNSGATLTLQDSSSSGGGRVTGGKGTLDGGVRYGGGVYVNGGTLIMTGGKIESNAANGELAGYGGGVYLNGGSFTLTGGEIKNNTAGGQAAGYGGGVGCGGSSTFEMSGSASISGNAANHSGGGGGVFLSGSTFTMKGGTISGNTASLYNGVLINVGSTLNRQGGTIVGGIGSSYGGGSIKYGVIFNANGHGAAPAVQNVEYNGKATKPKNPTDNGYVFGGWYKEAECINAWDFDTNTVTAATTLYAKWTPVVDKKVYYIKQNSDGTWPENANGAEIGTCSGASTTFIPDKSYEHYTISGWSGSYQKEHSCKS